ncbi:hypothetical protein C5C11_05170 [Rathayibacter rathayi]|nr:hypothetical protein C5C11_05170 [Rathayibacter rathayi]
MDLSLGRFDYAVAFVLLVVATVVQLAGLIALAVPVLVSADVVLERLGIPSARPWLVLAVAPAPAPAATPSAAQETLPRTAARSPCGALVAPVLETRQHGGDRTGTRTTTPSKTSTSPGTDDTRPSAPPWLCACSGSSGRTTAPASSAST